MKLQIFRSLWTNGMNLDGALADCASGRFDGVEGPVPEQAVERRDFAARLRSSGRPFIAEITTGGSYVPTPGLGVERHLASLREKLAWSLEAAPIKITVLGGSDAWSLQQSVDFFSQAIEISRSAGVPVCFETHRSRSTFHPWITRDILLAVPELRLTCDFSHWCCVTERLVMDEEPEILALCASRAGHIHARIGYEQGPQAPHPAAPEYAAALAAHRRWWQRIWLQQQRDGALFTTITPEAGPDGYLHTLPFTHVPVANLDEINHWMERELRSFFAENHLPTA